MPTIFIYNGPGVADVDDYYRSLSAMLNEAYTIAYVTAAEIIEGNTLKSCALLVIPGGADIPYCEAFNGAGNANIRAYVENGGCFLGICAGGYYGSRFCIFDEKDPKMAVVGCRELRFFEGAAKGPVLKKYICGEPVGIVCAKIFLSKMAIDGSIQNNHITPKYTYVHYHGGPAFIKGDQADVLAFYKKMPYENWYDTSILKTNDVEEVVPAVIFKKVGKGKVILSGVHLENSMFDAYCPQDTNFLHRKMFLRKILGEFFQLKLNDK